MNLFSRRTFMLGTAGTVATLASGAGHAWQAGAWANWPSLPIVAQEIYPTSLNGRIFVAGGFTRTASGFAISRNGYVLGMPADNCSGVDTDTCSPTWQSLSPLPEPRHHPNLVGHGEFVYAFGGFRANVDGAWNMIANTTRLSPETLGWTEMSTMPLPYGETVAMSLGDRIHVATGRQPNGSANANWNDHGDRGVHYVYDPASDRWDTAAPNPNPRNSAAGGVIDGRLHVVGGRVVNDGNRAHHEAYDPVEDRWHELAPLPQGQAGLCAAVHGGKLYAMGGEYFANGGGVYPQCWIYDPASDSWEAGPDMFTPRHGLGAVTIGDGIVVIGGATQAGGNGTSDLVEVLYPERI